MAENRAGFLKGVGRSDPQRLSERVAGYVIHMTDSLGEPNNDLARFQAVQRRRTERLKLVMSKRLKDNPEALKALEEFVQDLEAHLRVLEYNLKSRALHPKYDFLFATAAGVSMAFLYANLQAAEHDHNIRDEPEAAAA